MGALWAGLFAGSFGARTLAGGLKSRLPARCGIPSRGKVAGIGRKRLGRERKGAFYLEFLKKAVADIMARKIETHFVLGPAGRLESLLEEPEHAEPRYAALVCHPHPLYGGTMHNKVVYRIARGLRKTGAVVLRFNFRGVNLSEGEHAHGIGEVDDARAALDFLRSRYPHLPWMLAGFSFGSQVALRLGCSLQPAPRLVLAAGFPTMREDHRYLAHCGGPKVFIQSTHDEHGPRAELEAVYPGFADPKELYWVEAKDHFFSGALDRFEACVTASCLRVSS